VSPPRKRWQIKPPLPSQYRGQLRDLSSLLLKLLRLSPQYQERLQDLSPLLLQLLYNRGLTDPAQMRAFLQTQSLGSDPFTLKDMCSAVARLRRAIRRGELIAVYGDFDVDGVTATALLVQTLQALGAQVIPHIPHRISEGYGLNLDSLRQLYRRGVRVVLTVDCGIRSIEEIKQASRGLDIIVTDHHSVGQELPPALAVVNPQRPDCPYPFKDLAGVGVAFKLAQALLRVHRSMHGEPPLSEKDLLDLVALGTVADLAPLVEENRSLVRQGLEKLRHPQRPGVQALFQEAGLPPARVDATAIGFILGPRLNAAGRMAHAIKSYELLTASRPDEALRLAEVLGKHNRERQELTLRLFEQALTLALEDPDAPLFFVAGEDFPAGVVGLVAHRLTDEFYRPSVVVEVGPEVSRGSCRSIPEFHITHALDECQDLLIRHGGHAMAAGFTVANENLPALRERLRAIAERELAGLELAPILEIDAELPLRELTPLTWKLVEQMEPCGQGNPVPLFLARQVTVKRHRPVGAEGQHLKLTLSDGQVTWEAIAFRQGELAGQLSEQTQVDVVYTLGINEWNGMESLQLNVVDLKPSE